MLESLLIKFQVFRPGTLLKRDSIKGVFLLMLQIFFKKRLFLQNTDGGCLWNWDIFLFVTHTTIKIYEDSITQT